MIDKRLNLQQRLRKEVFKLQKCQSSHVSVVDVNGNTTVVVDLWCGGVEAESEATFKLVSPTVRIFKQLGAG
jgi:hypothetical protein